MRDLTKKHTGAYMAQVLKETLKDFNIEKDIIR